MPINFANQGEISNITFGGQQANRATLNGTVVWEADMSSAFTLANAGISFSVSATGIVSLSINQGTLVSTNYTNGQNLGTVSTNTTRTLTGSVRVPNDSSAWSNANQLISITGVSAVQTSTATFTVADWTGSISISSLGIVSVNQGNLASYTYDCSSTIGEFSCSTSAVTFPTVATNTTRVVSINGVVPSGYHNSGANIDITNSSVTQPANIITWSASNWTGSAPTMMNQQGTTISGQVTGNSAGPITLVSTESANTGADKQELITYRVPAPSPISTGTYSPSFFDADTTVTQTGLPTYELANAGIDFEVNRLGDVTITSSVTLTGTNYTNGQNIGLVSTATLRTLTGNVPVPPGYSNSGTNIPITGISDSQEATPTFSTSNAGISFDVAKSGLVALSITTGTLSGTNYTNGQNLGPVATTTTRTLTGSIIVPSGTDWFNGGASITITGVSDIQPLTPTWTIASANIGQGSLAVDAASGSVSGTPSVIGGDYIRHRWLVAGQGSAELSGDYDVIPSGLSSTIRTVEVTVGAPNSGFINPNAEDEGYTTVTQASSGLSEFTESDLNVTIVSVIDGDGATAVQVAMLLDADYSGTLSVTNGAVSANPSETTARTVNVNWAWAGTIPSGFIDANASTVLTGTVVASQGPATPAQSDATGAIITPNVIEFSSFANTQMISVDVTPENSDWNITNNSGGAVTFNPTSGNGDTTVTATWNEMDDSPPLGWRATVRSGTSTSGASLGNITMTTAGSGGPV